MAFQLAQQATNTMKIEYHLNAGLGKDQMIACC